MAVWRRRLFRLVLGAHAVALAATAPVHAQGRSGEVPQFSVGAWQGLALAQGGQFPGGCVMAATFSNGDAVDILLTTERSLIVAVTLPGGGPGWPGSATGPVRAWVDDEPEFAFSGRRDGNQLLLSVGSLTSRNGASVFRRLGEGRSLTVAVGDASHRYALRGTFGALAELLACAQRVRAGEVTFPRTPAPPPVASAPPPAAVAQRPAAPPASPPREPRVRSNGSGVVVSSTGHVLTANHVLEGCRSIRVGLAGSPPVEASVVGRDPRNDLALLKAATTFADVAAIRMDAVRIGENVVVYGFPLGGMLAASGNVTFGNVSALVGLGDDSRMLQVSAPVQPGNSGGPLFDGSGLVIGIVQSKLHAVNVARASGDIPQNVNFALRATLALSFAQANAVEPGVERRRSDLPQTEVAAFAQRVTPMVLCLE